jgi:hypothetical protein
MAKRLNQVLATEKGTKTRIYAEFTELHKATQKQELFEGHLKTYKPLVEDDPNARIPPQAKKVQLIAREALATAAKQLTELFDVTATKDWANLQAKSDVVVDGQVLLKDVPATYLLFLDKQLSDLMKFVSSICELDPGVDWRADPATGQYRGDPVHTQRTEKKQRAIVLYDATEHHPAQTQLITEDQVVGYWESTRFSGAIGKDDKQRILDRVRKLADAVKEALEKANMVEVTEQRPGATVFAYLFGG